MRITSRIINDENQNRSDLLLASSTTTGNTATTPLLPDQFHQKQLQTNPFLNNEVAVTDAADAAPVNDLLDGNGQSSHDLMDEKENEEEEGIGGGGGIHMEDQSFDVTLVKKEGSLGFTIHKKEDGFLYVKEVIKEPAISEPFLTPGDRILLVNGVDASSLSHEGAISFLRSLPETVTLRLQPVIPEDIMQEIDAACEGRGSSVKKSSKPLRHEARMMIKEKSVSPSNTDSLSRLKLRKEKMNRQRSSNNTNNNNNNSIDENDPLTSPSIAMVVPPLAPFEPSITSTPDNPRDQDRDCDHHQLRHQHHHHHRSHVLMPASSSGINLASAAIVLTPSSASSTTTTPGTTNNMSELRKTQSSDALLYCSTAAVTAPKHVVQIHNHDHHHHHHHRDHGNNKHADPADGAKRAKNCTSSASITLTVNGNANSSSSISSSSNNSANSNTSHQIHHHDDESSKSNNDLPQKPSSIRGFTKWRGQNLMQDPSGLDGVEQDSGFGDCTPKTTLEKPLRISLLKDQGYDVTDGHNDVIAAPVHSITVPAPDSSATASCNGGKQGPEYLEVTLEKGWASRLGIQLVDDTSGQEPKACVVKQIVSNTIASADGRVRVGYKILKVNDFDLRGKEAKYVIDLLRKMKGKICIKFLIQ